jgi:hypothetical protein
MTWPGVTVTVPLTVDPFPPEAPPPRAPLMVYCSWVTQEGTV